MGMISLNFCHKTGLIVASILCLHCIIFYVDYFHLRYKYWYNLCVFYFLSSFLFSSFFLSKFPGPSLIVNFCISFSVFRNWRTFTIILNSVHLFPTLFFEREKKKRKTRSGSRVFIEWRISCNMIFIIAVIIIIIVHLHFVFYFFFLHIGMKLLLWNLQKRCWTPPPFNFQEGENLISLHLKIECFLLFCRTITFVCP